MRADLLLTIVFLIFVFMLLTFFAFWRYLRHRETMALAEKGLLKPEEPDRDGHLGGGLVFLAIGLALLLGTYPIGRIGDVGEFLWSPGPLNLGPWLLPAFLFTFLGLALILLHVLQSDDDKAVSDAESPSLPRPDDIVGSVTGGSEESTDDQAKVSGGSN